MNERITITIHRDAYKKLKQRGIFGETYTQLILRLVKLAEADSSLEEKRTIDGSKNTAVL